MGFSVWDWWWWWWWIVFAEWLTDERRFSFISSRDHCQRSSPSQISGTPRAGFQPAQNLSSDFVEWSCRVVITTTPRRHNANCNMWVWISQFPCVRFSMWVCCREFQCVTKFQRVSKIIKNHWFDLNQYSSFSWRVRNTSKSFQDSNIKCNFWVHPINDEIRKITFLILPWLLGIR